MKIQYNKLRKILIGKNMNRVQLREAAGVREKQILRCVFQLHALGTLANTGLIPKNGGADCFLDSYSQ